MIDGYPQNEVLIAISCCLLRIKPLVPINEGVSTYTLYWWYI